MSVTAVCACSSVFPLVSGAGALTCIGGAVAPDPIPGTEHGEVEYALDKADWARQTP